jgi:O-methyltransferase
LNSKERFRTLQKILSVFVKDSISGGCFVECGVKQGSASVIMANNLNRKGYLFDTWTNMPHFGEYDAFTEKRRKKLRKRIKKGKNTHQECVDNLKNNNVFSLCEMIKGDICKTVPNFVRDNSNNLSICMMHSDSDLYFPTKVALENFWPFIINGGVVLIHDYNTKQWPGIKKIVDEFLHDKKLLYHVFDKDIASSVLIIKDDNNNFIKVFQGLISLIKCSIKK